VQPILITQGRLYRWRKLNRADVAWLCFCLREDIRLVATAANQKSQCSDLGLIDDGLRPTIKMCQ